MKSAAGVNTTSPLPSRATAPFTALETLEIESVSPSISVSLANSVEARIVNAVSSLVEALSLIATGASFTAATVTVTVCVVVPPLPSEII